MKRQQEESSSPSPLQASNAAAFFDNPRFSDCTLVIVAKSSYRDAPNRTPKKSIRISTEGDVEEDIERSPLTQKKLHVSKLVLAVQSTYFNELFHKQVATEVTIEVDTPKDIDYLIDIIRCIYGVEMETPSGDIIELFQLATHYGVRSAIEKCSQMFKELNSTSAVKILEVSEKLSVSPGCSQIDFTELIKKSKSYLSNAYGNLVASVQKEDFLEISIGAFNSLLESDQLILDSENTLLYAILIWTQHKPERKQYLESLLNYVKFSHLKPYYLLSVPLLFKDFPHESTKLATKLYNEAMEFKVGGIEWIKFRTPSDTHSRFEPRPNTCLTNIGSSNYPFEICYKFSGVSRWNIDLPQWSPIFFSNGYNLHFYLSKTKEYPDTIGIFIHLFNKLIEGEKFCLPITCTIYLGHQNGSWDKTKPFTSTFRRKSKGLTLDINQGDHIVADCISVKLEIVF